MAQIAYYSKFLSRTLNKNQAALRPVSLYINVVLCIIYLYPQKSDRIYTSWKFENVTLTGSEGQDPPCENGQIFSAESTGLFINYLTWSIAALKQTRHVVLCVFIFYPQSYSKSHRIYTIFTSSYQAQGGGSDSHGRGADPPPWAW